MNLPENPWLRWLLSPAGLLYRGGVLLRNGLYRRRLLKQVRAGVPVVSVGNLTLGGSGKTPFVAYLAGRLLQGGHRVAVASRGYGGKRQDRPVAFSAGRGPLPGAAEVGDEPMLLATLLPSAVVVVCRDRGAAALFARERFGADLVILDDGFQHLRLHRDLDLLLVDAVEGLGNGRMIPFGPLREPVEGLRRAGAVVVTGPAEALPLGTARIREEQERQGLDIPVFPCERRLEGFLRVETEEPVSPSALKGLKVLAFSGIARPASFESDLRSLGLDLVGTVRFQDHQPLGEPQVERIRAAARESAADLIVTTEKDRMRLGTTRLAAPLYTLRIGMVPSQEVEFHDFLRERLFPSPAASPGSGA